MPIPNMNPIPGQGELAPDRSFVGPPAGQPGMAPGGMEAGGGETVYQMIVQQISQIPIETLIELCKNPDQLVQMLRQLCEQQGMGKEESIAMSTKIMQAIFERVQNETGQAITDVTGQTGPSGPPSITQNPRQVLGG